MLRTGLYPELKSKLMRPHAVYSQTSDMRALTRFAPQYSAVSVFLPTTVMF